MKNQYQGEHKRSLRRAFCLVGGRFTKRACHLLMLLFAGGGGSAVADPVVNWALDTQAQPQSAQAIEEYWSSERMEEAVPMPLLEVPVDSGVAMPQRGESIWLPEAPPKLLPGWPPGHGPRSGPRSLIELTPEDFEASLMGGEVEPLASPPFQSPSSPNDFLNYAPFQRWTWFGRYLTYPTSTIGKVFFRMDLNGDGDLQNMVCSAAVIGDHTVATAGHCLHNGLDGEGANGGWATNVLFCPSFNQRGVNPVRGCWAAVDLVVGLQWFRDSSVDRDYGCIITDPQGGVNNGPIGNETGVLGLAFNFPSRQPTFAWGYPAGPPFPGFHIIAAASTEWYEVSMDPGDNHQVSKYIGSDMTGGSSGGPWWFGMSHPNFNFEYEDTDGSVITNPGKGFEAAPFLNGINSHRRGTANAQFSQEMGSPRFRDTLEDNGEAEDIFSNCFSLEMN